MNILQAFSTNLEAEVKGVWSPLSPGVEVLVARNATRAYSRLITKGVEEFSLVLEAKDEAADKVSEQIVINTMAEVVLLGWKGFTDDDGADVPYSKEKAKEYLALKDFRKKISEISGDVAKYKTKQEEATAANL